MPRENAPYHPGRPIVSELASGAVVASADRSSVLLLHHAAEARWCFPKGHVDPGESLAQAALREVHEESGLAAIRLVRELATVQYRFYRPRRAVNVLKTTVYFLAVTDDSTLHLEDTFDESAWCPPPDALQRLVFPAERRVLARALPFLAAR